MNAEQVKQTLAKIEEQNTALIHLGVSTMAMGKALLEKRIEDDEKYHAETLVSEMFDIHKKIKSAREFLRQLENNLRGWN